MALGDEAQQYPRGGAPAEGACRDCLHVRGSSEPHAVTLVADASNIRVCDGLVPRRERCGQDRDDQMAHPQGGAENASR